MAQTTLTPPAQAALVRPWAQVQREMRALAEAEEPASPRPLMTGLAAYITARFSEALRFKDEKITKILLRSQRQCEGEYEPNVLAKIRAAGGTEIFFNLTAPKVATFVAWVMTELSPYYKRPWKLEATPIPDLPDRELGPAVDAIVQQGKAMLAQTGQAPTGEVLAQMVNGAYDSVLDGMRKDAAERAKRMEDYINDQLVEGGFYEAMEQVVEDMAKFEFGVLKGPEFRVVRRAKWNGMQLEVFETEQPIWYAVSPYDLFWDPHSVKLGDSYVIEVVTWNPQDLAAMRGKEDYNSAEIDAVLQPGTEHRIYSGESTGAADVAALQNKENPQGSPYPKHQIEALLFWGAVQGQLLLDWGMPAEKIPNPLDYYDSCAMMIGEHVPMAILNPNPLHIKPYWTTSFIKKRGILGVSVPDQIKDCQIAYNATMRSLVNNQATASRFSVAADISVMEPDDVAALRNPPPGKVYPYKGANMGNTGRMPVTFFQPEDRSGFLGASAQMFLKDADDRSMIPRFTHGSMEASGAATTSSGLSQLSEMAARGILKAIANLNNNVLVPSIEVIYLWNLRNLGREFDSLKGDCRVVPGTTERNMAYRQALRYQVEFLDRTNNPTDMAILGMKGRRRVLESVCELLQIPADEVVPTAEMMQAQLMAQAAEHQALTGEQGAMGTTEHIKPESSEQRQGIQDEKLAAGRSVRPPGISNE